MEMIADPDGAPPAEAILASQGLYAHELESGILVVEYEDAYSIDRCFGDMALRTTLDLLGGHVRRRADGRRAGGPGPRAGAAADALSALANLGGGPAYKTSKGFSIDLVVDPSLQGFTEMDPFYGAKHGKGASGQPEGFSSGHGLARPVLALYVNPPVCPACLKRDCGVPHPRTSTRPDRAHLAFMHIRGNERKLRRPRLRHGDRG